MNLYRLDDQGTMCTFIIPTDNLRDISSKINGDIMKRSLASSDTLYQLSFIRAEEKWPDYYILKAYGMNTQTGEVKYLQEYELESIGCDIKHDTDLNTVFTEITFLEEES